MTAPSMADTEGGPAELPDAILFSPEQIALITQLVRAGIDAGSTAPVAPVVPPAGETAHPSLPPVGTTTPPTTGERRATKKGEVHMARARLSLGSGGGMGLESGGPEAPPIS